VTWNTDTARTLTETFDGAFAAPGVVTAAACIDETGTAIQVSPGDAPADGRFEIGSITKTMTAALLALLAAEGRLRLDDEVGRWVSAGANSAITLRQLATHTSGLARLAPNMDVRRADPENPWAGHGFEQAEEGLRQAVPAPDRSHRYSNHGYHLLGLVLERASGLSYEELITEALLAPLAMTCSGVGNSGGGTRLPGHADLGPVPHWTQPLGAGGIEATIGDLARYGEACLRPPRSPIGHALAAAQEPQITLEHGQQALAWGVRENGIRAHGGGTGGFSSALLIDPRQDRVVAMLASYGGCAEALSKAGLLALTGGDPRTARPQPPGPEWDDRAREIVQLLLDGQVAEVRARATAMFQDRISAERIDKAVRHSTQHLGSATEVLVRCRSSGDHVFAVAKAVFATGTVEVRISFTPSGEIAGLRIFSPAKPSEAGAHD
jgi:CubicO group peptidase (beta-lactamase class C family)